MHFSVVLLALSDALLITGAFYRLLSTSEISTPILLRASPFAAQFSAGLAIAAVTVMVSVGLYGHQSFVGFRLLLSKIAVATILVLMLVSFSAAYWREGLDYLPDPGTFPLKATLIWLVCVSVTRSTFSLIFGRGMLINNLSVALANAGGGAGAPTAIREAVDTYRRLAQDNPARFMPDLATSLNNMSAQLAHAGDSAGALAAIREAVEIRRRLAQENPTRFAPDLATSLNNLSLLLRDAGDGAGALAAIREAVDIRRRLVQENPARFAPDLARSLDDLSLQLREAGDVAGAQAAAQEASRVRSPD
jgi:tetratricopeptide (TPR) repeat protein